MAEPIPAAEIERERECLLVHDDEDVLEYKAQYLNRLFATIRGLEAEIASLRDAIVKLGGSGCEDGACHFCGKRYGHTDACNYASLKALAAPR